MRGSTLFGGVVVTGLCLFTGHEIINDRNEDNQRFAVELMRQADKVALNNGQITPKESLEEVFALGVLARPDAAAIEDVQDALRQASAPVLDIAGRDAPPKQQAAIACLGLTAAGVAWPNDVLDLYSKADGILVGTPSKAAEAGEIFDRTVQACDKALISHIKKHPRSLTVILDFAHRS